MGLIVRCFLFSRIARVAGKAMEVSAWQPRCQRMLQGEDAQEYEESRGPMLMKNPDFLVVLVLDEALLLSLLLRRASSSLRVAIVLVQNVPQPVTNVGSRGCRLNCVSPRARHRRQDRL